MNDIKDFRIGTAFYLLENKKGSRIRLDLDYAENNYSSRILMEGGNLERLLKQADIIAKNMLAKKARKNLNYKLLELKV